jgi:hypothetical protein
LKHSIESSAIAIQTFGTKSIEEIVDCGLWIVNLVSIVGWALPTI